MACTQYQADVLAAEFGKCKCGYPKQSHVIESENKAAVAKRALRPSTREASKLQCEPCADYIVNVSASTFGQCYCGHPKDAHVCKSENKAATERAKLDVKERECLRVSTRTASMLEPCSDFKVDTKAAKFGMCICGHPLDAHKATIVNPAEAERAKLDAKKRESLRLSTRTANMSEPCSDFKVDTKAAKFGMCICGHAQDAHKVAIVNPAEAALRALREKNAPNASLCEETSDPDMENDVVVEASPKVEAEQNGVGEEEIKTGSILKLPLRYDFGFGIGSCSVCRSLCRNRGCKDSYLTFCHRCWPDYICGIAL